MLISLVGLCSQCGTKEMIRAHVHVRRPNAAPTRLMRPACSSLRSGSPSPCSSQYKDCYLAYILNEYNGNSMIVFAATCNTWCRPETAPPSSLQKRIITSETPPPRHCTAFPCGLSSSSSSSSLLCLSVSHMSRPSKAASVSSPSVLSTRLAILLRSLGFGAVPLHGQVSRHGLQLQSRLRTLLQL